MIYLDGKPVEPTIFPDGTSQVWHLGRERGPVKAHVTWRFEREAEVVHLAQLLHLLTEHDNAIELHVPYLPYGRQDKPVFDDSTFALRTFVLMMLDFQNVLWRFLDPHPSSHVDPLRRLRHARVEPRIAEIMLGGDYDAVLLPDGGALTRYAARLEDLCGVEILHCDKERDPATGRIAAIRPPEIPKGVTRLLVADDLCDGGATFVEIARLIAEQAPDVLELDLYVTHGIFSKGIDPLLEVYDHVFTTDSYRRELSNFEALKVAARQNPIYAQFRDALTEGCLIVQDCQELMNIPKEFRHA
jgi:ribose-phosphate pyrophosphokinase